MAKIIKYQFLSCEVCHGAGGNGSREQIILDKQMLCPTQADYIRNIALAEREAVGQIILEGEFDSEK